ncbi:MAG: prepilin-type N-terminal cleavage/methylation domain-containing protein [candidate division Zixibacteria bacterium]|nr:prepilin-type N-terminal cleavage/methylation domain-containing protein [candidate division Zixibacteria bacterium]
MNTRVGQNKGFTLVELVIVIVVLGILAAVAIPKFLDLRRDSEIAAVGQMVASLESAMSIYAARQYTQGGSVALHNPFDDLANVPTNYKGINDPVTPANTPNGHWSYRPTGNWIMYNPRTPITGGWTSGGETFIIYQMQAVTEGADTVGLRLVTTPAFEYSWN